MMIKGSWLLAVMVLMPLALQADEGLEHFSISHFDISGNQLFTESQLQSLVAPYVGDARTVADIRNAQRAIENAYLSAGYGTVRATIPEQELTQGRVRIDVVEAKIAQVKVIGNRHFDETNIRTSVPALQAGSLPNLREISENVQLANENPAKRVEVVLSGLPEEGELEARLLVKDEKPLRFSASLDNTGNHETGRLRAGVALQHANLFDRDHVATLAYITAPEEPQKVDIYSLSYRLPIYAWGDSVDFIYGHSSVDSGTAQTVAGPLNFSGSGEVMALRYNHYFPRKGEFSSRLTLGLDRREYDNSCNVAGLSCGSADSDVVIKPLSLTWAGQWEGNGKRRELFASVAHNIPGGSDGDDDAFEAVRNGADADYQVFRLGGSWIQAIAAGWQGRIAINGQYAPQPLVPGEQLGLAGATSVRGFNERAVSVDTGVYANVELYSPNFAGTIGLGDPASIRALLFMDIADGRNRDVISASQIKHATLSSIGLGLRADWSNRVSIRLDLARVTHTHDLAAEDTGDVRGHFAINVLF